MACDVCGAKGTSLNNIREQFATDDVRAVCPNCERVINSHLSKLELARTRECCALLLSQHDPVYSLGVDRARLKVLLDFVRHHDPARLRRECEALLPKAV